MKKRAVHREEEIGLPRMQNELEESAADGGVDHPTLMKMSHVSVTKRKRECEL